MIKIEREPWMRNAKARGWHYVFCEDAIARRRWRLWKLACKLENEACVLVREDGMEARIEVWMPGSASPIAYRGHVNKAPDKADELAQRLGAWRRVSEPAYESIEV